MIKDKAESHTDNENKKEDSGESRTNPWLYCVSYFVGITESLETWLLDLGFFFLSLEHER
jgi:hypothetical protein